MHSVTSYLAIYFVNNGTRYEEDKVALTPWRKKGRLFTDKNSFNAQTAKPTTYYAA